jgi:hypothetical protein
MTHDSEEWNDLNHNGRYDGLEEWDISFDENGNGVWDGDYLRDGDEVFGTYNGIKTDPLKWDTDLDSLTYFVVYAGGKVDYTFRMSDGDELYYYGTNPTYGDTDRDGIADGWELYLGSGLIPDFKPMPLNPLSNDTDGDTLLDGLELMIANFTSLIYPYIGFYAVRPYNTSPVLPDSDFDYLNDSEEIDIYYTRPDCVDTDNDTLSDYDEIFFHLTDPLKNDTDADGFLDCNETTAVVPLIGIESNNIRLSLHLTVYYDTVTGIEYYPDYPTDATDRDTDNDLLPDGAELDPELPYYQAGTDPMITDSLVNGTRDGLLFDSDHDYIPDGYEFFGDGPNGTLTPTALIAGGGPFNPDSDHDGLIDGLEWLEYGTNATNWDTDNDTFSDGLEILLGTNATGWTDPSEIHAALDTYRGDLVITSPIETTYESELITVTATNFTLFSTVKYRFTNGPVSHEETDMVYNSRQYQYQSQLLSLTKGAYTLEVIGTKSDSSEVVKRIRFYIQMEPLQIEPILIGGVIGFGAVSIFLYLISIIDLQKFLFWQRKEGGL